MERVTLGVVGDEYVGKSMLCISYTENYVFKDYKPTVLNCHWTNVIVDGHVVDLRIWDNSGSDEYAKLRPLSYPQTDVFLVCFSLKNLKSLVNIRDVWIPEIEANTNRRVPIILVGCKRDKHCEAPQTDILVNGSLTGVQYAHQENVYSYHSASNYTCDVGFELDDGIQLQQAYCLQQTNTWQTLEGNCSIVSCQSFTVDNGNVTVQSLEFQGTAEITCFEGNWADNGLRTMEVTCQHDRTWTTAVPTCLPTNLKRKDRIFNVIDDKKRDESVMVSELDSRSRIDCAARCADEYYCVGANFKQTSGNEAGTCRLFLEESKGADFSTDLEWKYLDLQ